ncbi:MAG: hypothetical protein ACE5HU_03730 [Acidobacteriota bacterium]
MRNPWTARSLAAVFIVAAASLISWPTARYAQTAQGPTPEPAVSSEQVGRDFSLAQAPDPAEACCARGASLPGKLFVMFQTGTPPERMEEIAEQLGASVLHHFRFSPSALLSVPNCQELTFIPLLEGLPDVRRVILDELDCNADTDTPFCTCCPPEIICSDLPRCEPPSFDETAPQITAMIACRGDDDCEEDEDEGSFTIGVDVMDSCDPGASVTSVLLVPGCDAIPVSDGQAVEFEGGFEQCQVDSRNDTLEIKGPSLTLLVTATDASGNAATVVTGGTEAGRTRTTLRPASSRRGR